MSKKDFKDLIQFISDKEVKPNKLSGYKTYEPFSTNGIRWEFGGLPNPQEPQVTTIDEIFESLKAEVDKIK